MKTKSPLQSKTIWGGIVLVVLQFFGVAEIEMHAAAEAMATLVGFALVLYGRIKAQLPVKLTSGGGGSDSASLIAVGLVGSCMIGATLLNTGCQGYRDWAEQNPQAASLLETAAHAAIVYAINDQAQEHRVIAEQAETLKHAAHAAFREGADEAEVARILAESVFALYPRDAEARDILLAGFRRALTDPDPDGDGIPASDQERVSAALIEGHLVEAFATVRQQAALLDIYYAPARTVDAETQAVIDALPELAPAASHAYQPGTLYVTTPDAKARYGDSWSDPIWRATAWFSGVDSYAGFRDWHSH